MTRFPVISITAFTVSIVAAVGHAHASAPWDFAKLREPPEMRWIDPTSPIRSLALSNEPYQGKQTEVFAFYATPGTISGDPRKDVNLPAVVLLHGGGGTAFAEWVWLWAERGYAAIALDLCGNRPAAPEFDPATRQLLPERNHGRLKRARMEWGGPDEGHVAKFVNVGGDVTDDWQYHAVAAAMRAHSLVRSFNEVDADRTAVTGISWGGYLTCLVASMDDRFKAAVPVYGCGFLYEGESVQKPQIDRLPAEKRRLWIQVYEPSAWLDNCRVPIFFVNGTNDKHYPLTSYARTYGLVTGPRQIRIEVNMPHGHGPGWAPKEIGLFIDQYLRGGTPLPQLDQPTVRDARAIAPFSSELPLKLARFHYTSDTGPLVERQWESTAADIGEKELSANLPPEARIWMFSATDTREAMVSTGVVFVD